MKFNLGLKYQFFIIIIIIIIIIMLIVLCFGSYNFKTKIIRRSIQKKSINDQSCCI
jgi:uncharacterized membrane protein affecting hemolysin expression